MAYKPKKAPVTKTVKKVGKMVGKAKAKLASSFANSSPFAAKHKLAKEKLTHGPAIKKSVDIAAKSMVPIDHMKRKNKELGMNPPDNRGGKLAPPPSSRLKREDGISGHNGSFKFKVMGNRKGYKAGE